MPSQLPLRAGTSTDHPSLTVLAGLLVMALVLLNGCQQDRDSSEMPPDAQQQHADPQPRNLTPADVEESDVVKSGSAKIAAKTVDDLAREFADERERMIQRDLRGRDISDESVLRAMARVPRHLSVPVAWRDLAYADRPLPIGLDQTISQPYIVALMTQLAEPGARERALDIGTGSGYQAAVLGELVKEVYSIEIHCPLADEARARLEQLGHDNIQVRCGDGYRGWPEHAPFDVIIVAAAPDHVPQPLLDQLAVDGRLVIPVGDFWQELVVITKHDDGSTSRQQVAGVRFVPMTGEAEQR